MGIRIKPTSNILNVTAGPRGTGEVRFRATDKMPHLLYFAAGEQAVSTQVHYRTTYMNGAYMVVPVPQLLVYDIPLVTNSVLAACDMVMGQVRFKDADDAYHIQEAWFDASSTVVVKEEAELDPGNLVYTGSGSPGNWQFNAAASDVHDFGGKIMNRQTLRFVIEGTQLIARTEFWQSEVQDDRHIADGFLARSHPYTIEYQLYAGRWS